MPLDRTRGEAGAPIRSGGIALRAPLVLLAVLSVFSVYLINGGPLFYFDTVGFIDQGTIMLRQLGLLSAVGDGSGLAGGLPDPDGDGNVSGSRAAAYALLLAITAKLGALSAVVVMNALAAVVTVWLPARVMVREGYLTVTPLVLVSLALIVGGLSSMPFIVAFLLPDILTSCLIAIIALLAAFAGRMRAWEIGVALLFMVTAVVSHLSHLAIATMAVPVVFVVALFVGPPRRFLATVLIAGVVLVGYAERVAFRVSVETVADAEVVYYPFMTARLIVDGPGYAFLEEHCPDPEIDTCALWEALSWSDDPYRLTPSHIIFETSQRLGSYRLMESEDQALVAQEQREFFERVLFAHPVGVAMSFARNTLKQMAMFNVYQSIPEPAAVRRATEDLPPGMLSPGRLDDPGIGDRLEPLHALVYAISLGIVLWRLLGPLPRPIRLFVIVVILGLIGNGFVCGAISQPADRYGARAIWLLPVLAAILLATRRTREAS